MKKVSQKARILVVDDLPKNLQVLAAILSHENLKTIVATNGAQALSIARKNPPDLILLDISMPEMDGFEVCQKLKAEPLTAEIPVIFLTARNQSEDVIQGFDVGAVDYITKPFNSKEMLQRVYTHLNLKNARDTINKQNKELQQLNATKDRLFSIIAHDLRGPVGNFQTMLDLLIEEADHFDPESTRNMLEMLREAAGKSYYLLENLLQWSRNQRQEISVSPSSFDLYALIRELFSLFKSQAHQKKLSLNTNITQAYPIYADQNMTNTIIRNLLNNAIKFTPNGGNIQVCAEKLNEQEVKISVTDTGIGIKAEDQAKLFKSSEYFTTYGTEQEKGSGLGLSLCYDFVRLHGSELKVDSEPDKGSTFWFILSQQDKQTTSS